MKVIRTLAVSLLGVFSLATALAFTAAPAQAQATRTWVSGVGDDVNPCSRTAPCKTFAGAISKTAAGGEINCLDPGGFGTLTITKSITVDCTGTFGSTLDSGGVNGFVVNDSLSATPGNAEVRLRGISINGAGTTPGLNGIRFVSGKSLTVENVFIQNQLSGSGISIAPSSGSVLVNINNSVLAQNGGNASGSGIEIRPTGTASVMVGMNNVDVLDAGYNGIRVDGSATSGQLAVTINDSQIASAAQGINVIANFTLNTKVAVTKSVVLNNSENGIVANGNGVQVRVADTVITGNFTGVNPAGGSHIYDLGRNMLSGNSTDGAFN